jgi:hypothetical protein
MKNFFYKWFVLSKKERDFIWLMEMLEEKYNYACLIERCDLTFNEFLNFYKRNLIK